mmetsp:Transcript_12409/g.14248  ORF Transcript_12409/g.14248 Transcript_12409/m.14248 type:complete len:103 (+) Transcript_12409:74-382(+)
MFLKTVGWYALVFKDIKKMRIPVSKLKMPKNRFNNVHCYFETTAMLTCLATNDTQAKACKEELKALEKCMQAHKKSAGKRNSSMNFHIQRLAKKGAAKLLKK